MKEILIALAGGISSLLSPCILPLLPVYSWLFATASVAGYIGFVIAFSLVYVLLGAASSAIGAFLIKWQGWILVILGIVLPLTVIFKHKIFKVQTSTNTKTASSFFEGFGLGLGMAMVWTGCVGPVLSSILSIAMQQKLFKAVVMMLAYTVGLLAPFFALLALIKVKPEIKKFLSNKYVMKAGDILVFLISAWLLYKGIMIIKTGGISW